MATAARAAGCSSSGASSRPGEFSSSAPLAQSTTRITAGVSGSASVCGSMLKPWRPAPILAASRSARWRLATTVAAAAPSISRRSRTGAAGSAVFQAQPLIRSCEISSTRPSRRAASAIGDPVRSARVAASCTRTLPAPGGKRRLSTWTAKP